MPFHFALYLQCESLRTAQESVSPAFATALGRPGAVLKTEVHLVDKFQAGEPNVFQLLGDNLWALHQRVMFELDTMG